MKISETPVRQWDTNIREKTTMTTLDHALDTAMQLPYKQRETPINILLKRQVEHRREEIAENAREAVRAFHAGELKSETAEALIRRLHTSVEDGNDKEKT